MDMEGDMGQFMGNAFNGIQIIQVDEGTVVDGHNGDKITVTDKTIALNSMKAYVTPRVYEQIKKVSA